MKYSTIILTFSLTLSACSTTNKEVKKEPIPEPPKLNVLAQICVKTSKKSTLNIFTTERSGAVISAHSYQAALDSKTSDNMNVYSALVGLSMDLTYFTIENFSDSTTYFLINRNFNQYQLNEWGKWEEPDYLFKEGTQYKFLPLSTSPIDSTDKLLKIKFSKQDPIRVRFKLVEAQKYISDLNQEKINGNIINSCLN